MADFKSIYDCPNCRGQLEVDYTNQVAVCSSCGKKFSFQELSRFVSKPSSMLETGNSIYSATKYEEALTIKSVENLTYDALLDRMQIALNCQGYTELNVYIKELLRRYPDNCIPYEYKLLSKYKVYTLNDFKTLNIPYYNDEEYKMFYHLADAYKKAELDSLYNEVHGRIDAYLLEQQKIKHKKEKKQKVAGFFGDVFDGIIGFLPIFFKFLFVFLPVILSIVSGIILFKNAAELKFSASFPTLVTFWVLFTGGGIVIVGLQIKCITDDEFSVPLSLFSLGPILFSLIFSIVAGAKTSGDFNPTNEITLTFTGVRDYERYGQLASDFLVTINYTGKYKLSGFGGQLEIFKGGTSLGTWNYSFQGDYTHNMTVNSDLELTGNSKVYYATFDEMSVKYQINYVVKSNDYEKVYFESTFRWAKQ